MNAPEATFLWGDAAPPASTPTPTASGEPVRRTAEAGLWIFVMGDLVIFSIFFVTLLHYRREDQAVFRGGASSLSQTLGVANTLVLLLSSYLVVAALARHRSGEPRAVRSRLAATIGCAGLFAGIKAAEYASSLADAHTPGSDLFFTFYWTLTGIHLIHVLIGGVLLGTWAHSAVRYVEEEHDGLPAGAALYWHMVDLLWVMIFGLLYVVSAT